MNDKEKMTDKFVETFIKKNERMPTLSEIGKHFGISRSAAFKRMVSLKSKYRDVHTKSNIVVSLKYTVPAAKQDKFFDLVKKMHDLVSSPQNKGE